MCMENFVPVNLLYIQDFVRLCQFILTVQPLSILPLYSQPMPMQEGMFLLVFLNLKAIFILFDVLFPIFHIIWHVFSIL